MKLHEPHNFNEERKDIINKTRRNKNYCREKVSVNGLGGHPKNCYHSCTPSCTFTCVCLQTAVPHELQAHMDLCMVDSQYQSSAMWRWSQRRTRTLTSYLKTVWLWTHLLIDDLGSNANRASAMPKLLSKWVLYIVKTDCYNILYSLDRVEVDKEADSYMVTKFSTSNSHKESCTFITEKRPKSLLWAC